MTIFTLNTRTVCSLLVLSAVVLGGCRETPQSKYSLSELQDHYTRCQSNTSKSPSAAVSCGNIEKECERRAKDKGRKVCF